MVEEGNGALDWKGKGSYNFSDLELDGRVDLRERKE